MTEPSIYLLQAKANEESAKIAQKDFPEWAIIMYFYAALHLINDYAYERNQLDELEGHSSRRNYVKTIARDTGFKDLIARYDELFGESLLARYLEKEEYNGEFTELGCTAREHYSKYTVKDFEKIDDKLQIIK
ncbi:MAG: hypothetical protein ACKO2Z_12925, partial [Sphaerospermopsis kisseleviana]